ncbi:hypothetical protein SESBI_47185 [Sesbania bispinosa]|nr:hypothetical protein SESBI_47185 [Sesbania bispinosa]
MRYLNPGVELNTRGMSALCAVEDGKWFRCDPSDNVECEPGDEVPSTPALHDDDEEIDADPQQDK